MRLLTLLSVAVALVGVLLGVSACVSEARRMTRDEVREVLQDLDALGFFEADEAEEDDEDSEEGVCGGCRREHRGEVGGQEDGVDLQGQGQEGRRPAEE
eukprot:EC785730.1.p3 GENE.EC785730.1~~EC785730.1.p3  ORF type:complete len:99 (+),score=17.77 EC785730.1:3-299(+)